ncbi:MAG TPA: hypothetical protein VKB47_08715 [Terracidiphilus sp.]|nr:hypothetical protein [Terracidiphilus sp.]
MLTYIQSLARMEGFGKAGDIPTRDHNPGDICAGKFTSAHGAIGADGRFAQFATDDEGFAALRALLLEHYVGMTVAAAIAKYAPACENCTANYIKVVCQLSGLTPDTVLTADNIG